MERTVEGAVARMKISVDTEKCTGHARCNAAAAAVYPLDSDGYCAVREIAVAPSDEAAAREGAAACPERAISIIE